jgi:hypothetical protein
MSDYGDDGGGDFGAGEYVSTPSTPFNLPLTPPLAENTMPTW